MTFNFNNNNFDETLVQYHYQPPQVLDDGIYVPLQEYVPDGFESNYKLLITKEVFIEAYNKWIKGENNVK